MTGNYRLEACNPRLSYHRRYRSIRSFNRLTFLTDHFQREIGQDNNEENANDRLNFPWYKVQQLMDAALWD